MPGHGTRKRKSCGSHGGTRKQRGGFLLKRIGALAKKMKPLGNTVTKQMQEAHRKTMGHVDNLLTHMKNAGNNKHVLAAKKNLEKARDHGLRLHEELKQTQVGKQVTGNMRNLHEKMSDGISQAHQNLRLAVRSGATHASNAASRVGAHNTANRLLKVATMGGRKKRGHKKRHATKKRGHKKHGHKKHGHKKRHATKKHGHKKRKQRGGACNGKGMPCGSH